MSNVMVATSIYTEYVREVGKLSHSSNAQYGNTGKNC